MPVHAERSLQVCVTTLRFSTRLMMLITMRFLTTSIMVCTGVQAETAGLTVCAKPPAKP